jgi:tRNA nucleotidyltransferase (CCA-adding enzyme)
MTTILNSVLKEALERVNPPKLEMKFMENSLKSFEEIINKKIKLLKIDAEIFVGGSFAKKTMIKKSKYDIDVFLRFNKKYKEQEILLFTKRLLESFQGISTIHGSRDYFQVRLKENLFIELVPVIKVKKPSESKNITDLSYSHVKYIRKKVKQKNILDEIKIAKAFCHATSCYGAESYINGFSGYSLELLVYYYGGFLSFIKAIAKMPSTNESKDKTVIDIEKHFKNKQSVLMDLNGSKLNSPIILIDPTYRQRNALAALSTETFLKFQEACKNFLNKPSIDFFEIQKINLDDIKEKAKKNNYEFIIIETKTNKQEGDVAGTKLFKFYNHLTEEIQKFFEIKDKFFEYDEKSGAKYYFVVKSKGKIVINGPYIDDKKNFIAFKKAHKNYFVKKERLFADEIIKIKIAEFIDMWKMKNQQKMKDMSIESLRVV